MRKFFRWFTPTAAFAAVAIILSMAAAPARAASDPLRVRLAGTDWILPLQKTSVTQLYSFAEGTGYPAVETVLAGWGDIEADSGHRQQLTAGAAAVLGTSHAVPFIGIQTRLSNKFFDTSNNALLFGVWAGHRDDVPHPKRVFNEAGIKVSRPIW